MNTGSDEPGEVAVAPDETGTDEERSEQERGLGSRAPEFIKARRLLHVPGPGWVVIFGGMAIWATEFVWAQLVLRWTKRKVTEAAQRALDPKVRRRNIILTSIGLVIVAVLVGIYVWKFGMAMPWKIKNQ
jgi:uncharacterized protein (TIGR02611 family)